MPWVEPVFSVIFAFKLPNQGKNSRFIEGFRISQASNGKGVKTSQKECICGPKKVNVMGLG